ncbi:MAG: DUF1566 domain-containing protein [Geobacter sp.]|nr:DUF1566 domain-containing protein [Geobacter sp.]
MKKLALSMMLFLCVLAVAGAAWCGDNGDGTVTVNGRVWLKDAWCLGWGNWGFAMLRPKSLAHGQCGLTDNSKPGDWRLPTVDELKAVYPYKGQFRPARGTLHWSSSAYRGGTTDAWLVSMRDGSVHGQEKKEIHYIWAVRGGQ